jgi:hypothetical protein
MTTDITELAQSLKAAAEKYKSVWGIARYSKAVEAREKFHELVTPANVIALVEVLEKAQRANGHLREQSAEWERKAISNFEECAKLSRRVEELESRAVKLPDELSWETLLDVASRADLVYSDDTGVLEYTNIIGCFVKITAPPDKVIRFRLSNDGMHIRLVDRVKTREHAGIIIDINKNYNEFIW